jgi:hypothetical protein
MTDSSRLLLSDPFLAEVRRRRPDVDIVVLPPERPAQSDVRTAAELDGIPERLPAELAELWAHMASDPALPDLPSGVWTATGATSVRCRVEARIIDIPIDVGTMLPAKAGRALTELGWQVLVPPRGLPRVQAVRGDTSADRSLLILYVAESDTLVVRYDAGPVEVDGFSRRALVPEAADD